jgi:hypothetical protein
VLVPRPDENYVCADEDIVEAEGEDTFDFEVI